MRTKRMRGGGHEADGTMNAFINHYNKDNVNKFQGILAFFNNRETIRIFITPNNSPGFKGGYIIRCEPNDWRLFVSFLQKEDKPKFSFTKREFPDGFFGPLRPPPVIPSGEEEYVFPPVPEMTGKPVTVDELLEITKLPLSIEVGDPMKRILMRYQQPEEPDMCEALFQWMNANEERFLREFAIPHFCYHTQHSPKWSTPLPTGVNWPSNVFEFTDLTPEKIEFLKSRPYRLLNLLVTPHDASVMVQPTIPSQSDYVMGLIYCHYDKGMPLHIPREYTDFLIESSLRTNQLLPNDTPKMMLIDLYLHRDRASTDDYSFFFHSDSSRMYSETARDTVTIPGAENVEYLSLMMIMPKNHISKSTSLISNIESGKDRSANYSTSHGRCKSVLTLSVTSGTTLCFSDIHFVHTTPCLEITKKLRPSNESIAGMPAFVPETVLLSPTLLTQILDEEAKAMLKASVQRCFVRTHFVNHRRITYTPVDDPINIPYRFPVSFERGVTETLKTVDELNSVLSSGEFGKSAMGRPFGLKLGGSKRKKRKTKKKKLT
jgi:hypothetical protein